MSDDRIRESFRLQAGWCRQLGSPLTAALVEAALADLDEGGVVASIVSGFEGDPVESVLPLRLLGGVHRLVLMGVASHLARHYPSVGGSPDDETLARDFLATVTQHPGYLADALAVAPQTNEIGRSAALLPGLAVALGGRRFGVRLLEIGTAGGLNLLADRYRYECGTWAWGDPGSPATVTCEWRGPVPPMPDRFAIGERMGCDLHPLDVSDEEGELRLLSFIWPDQVDRFERMRGAIALARRSRIRVDRSDAPRWLRARLLEPTARNTLTVIQHSVMWMYLDDGTRGDILRVIDDAGSRAARRRPLAHVSYERSQEAPASPEVTMELIVTTWPGGETRRLATGHAHGAWIEWHS